MQAAVAPRVAPTPESIALLRVLLNDPIPPGGTDADCMFTDAALAVMLQMSDSMAEAAYLGWTQKAMLYADPNRLVRAQIGSETLEFSNPAALIKWANDQAEWWKQQVEPKPVMWLRSVQAPCFFGVEGPYSEQCGQRAGTWLDDDASRLGGTYGYSRDLRSGLHGVTGGGPG